MTCCTGQHRGDQCWTVTCLEPGCGWHEHHSSQEDEARARRRHGRRVHPCAVSYSHSTPSECRICQGTPVSPAAATPGVGVVPRDPSICAHYDLVAGEPGPLCGEPTVALSMGWFPLCAGHRDRHRAYLGPRLQHLVQDVQVKPRPGDVRRGRYRWRRGEGLVEVSA